MGRGLPRPEVCRRWEPVADSAQPWEWMGVAGLGLACTLGLGKECMDVLCVCGLDVRTFLIDCVGVRGWAGPEADRYSRQREQEEQRGV